MVPDNSEIKDFQMALVASTDYPTPATTILPRALARVNQILSLRNDKEELILLTKAMNRPAEHLLPIVTVEIGRLDTVSRNDYAQTKPSSDRIHLNMKWMIVAQGASETVDDTTVFNMHLTLLIVNLLVEYIKLYTSHVSANLQFAGEDFLFINFKTKKSTIFNPTNLTLTDSHNQKFMFKTPTSRQMWMTAITSDPIDGGIDIFDCFRPRSQDFQQIDNKSSIQVGHVTHRVSPTSNHQDSCHSEDLLNVCWFQETWKQEVSDASETQKGCSPPQ